MRPAPEAGLWLAVLALACAACQRPALESADDAASSRPHAEETVYDPARGLTLGSQARTSLGLQTREVGMAAHAVRRQASAHLFRLSAEPSAARYRSGRAYVSALLAAQDAGAWKPGFAVALVDGSGRRHAATVQRLDGQMRGWNGTMEAILEVPDAPDSWNLGTSLTVEWTDEEVLPEPVPVLPESAFLETARGTFVYVENGGAYLRTLVARGPADGGMVQVLEGVFEGDVVVVQGAAELYLAELQAVNAGTGCAHGH